MAGQMEMREMREHRQTKGKQIACAVAASVLALAGAEHAYAQAGIGVLQTQTRVGTIGHNKGQANAGPVLCPAGTIVTGIYHKDKGTGAAGSTVGMTADFGLYCSSVSTDGTNVILQQSTANGTPAVRAGDYRFSLPAQNQYCGTNRIGHAFGGWDRDWDQPGGYPAWSSALYMDCATLSFTPSDGWMRMNTASGSLSRIEVGVREVLPGYDAHQSRGPWCGDSSTSLVTGLYAERGGEGHDGINVYCGTLVQARHSAILTFTDFAWSQTRGAGNWLVNLNLGSTLLQNAAGMSGANKTPYATAAGNAGTYNAASEVYVVPNSNYQASVSNRPSGIAANTYYLSGSCLTGQTLSNLQDASCTLNVEGLPDLTPSVTSPATTYSAYNANQNMTIGVSNLGPGAVVAADGYTIDATLPAGWTAGPLPAGCVLAGQIVRCSVPALTAASAPGATGGTTSWTFPVRATTSANGTFSVQVVVNTSVPNTVPNDGNDDYNPANNTTTGQVILNRTANLQLSKVWVNANVGDQATLTATSTGNPTATLVTTADTAGETDVATAVNAPLGAVYVLNESLAGANVGAYTASPWTCSAGLLNNSNLTIRVEDLGQTITCTVTNTRQTTDISVTKTALPVSVLSGQDITWTITARNNGPTAANGTILTDTPGAGQDCATPPPPPTCVQSGGATCPTTYTAAALAAGVTIPQFPVNGQIVITLTCRATASGL